MTDYWTAAPTRIEALFEAERDQLPLWLPVGLGAGVAAWFALPDLAAFQYWGPRVARFSFILSPLAVQEGSRQAPAPTG